MWGGVTVEQHAKYGKLPPIFVKVTNDLLLIFPTHWIRWNNLMMKNQTYNFDKISKSYKITFITYNIQSKL